MRVLLDTNVGLDFALRREPWFSESGTFWLALRHGRISGHVAAAAVTDIFYIARRLAGLPAAHAAVRICLNSSEIVPVCRDILEAAAAMLGNDFEDNVQIACAEAAGVDAIVTRDADGFRHGSVPALTPVEAAARLP